MAGVFSIPPGVPFAKTLAELLLREAGDRPEALARVQVFLPTRRACRVLQRAFGDKPRLLPRLMPLGDVEEDDLSLQIFGAGGEYPDIPPGMPSLQRRLLLARMIMGNPAYGHGMDHALGLAQELGRFIDQVTIEGLDFADLYKIVPEEFADHWRITLDFLKIITENWPEILAAHGMIDSAQRRNILLKLLAQHWEQTPPDYPVIAAGSTGSIPATANLLRVIANLPQGRVILPGLDNFMDAQSWGHVAETHPQYGQKHLLEVMNHKREDVGIIAEDSALRLRIMLASEMMRPAQTTEGWKDFAAAKDRTEMLQHLEYYPCQTPQEEAQVVALALREALEVEGKTVAVITPDRALARRVRALCRRWNIEIDDSAGRNLWDSALGAFTLLALRAAETFDPVAILALLRHEYCSLAKSRLDLVAELEKYILRRDEAFAGLDDILGYLDSQGGRYGPLAEFLSQFREAIDPLRYVLQQEKCGFEDLLLAHLATMENLTGAEILWDGEDGESAASFFSELQGYAKDFSGFRASEYGGILDVLMKNVTIRVPYGVHPRVALLGQLEARLNNADLTILCGLNEGTWPQDNGHDPWLSRPMRRSFGLPAAEKSIGLAAHDFVQGFCAPQVIITRALKADGAPTTPARWLQRLDTVLKAGGGNLSELQVRPYLSWAQHMDRPQAEDFAPYSRPEPRPPLVSRPTGISITRVENWVRDPYGVYAADVLRLRKLKPLVQDNDAAFRGTFLHEVLERFTGAYPDHLPPDAEDKMIEIAREHIVRRVPDQAMLRYWWPRFLKIAAWYVQHERDWRRAARFTESEVEGNADIEVDGVPFNLQGKPDRIDKLPDGYAIIDYKSGSQFKKSKLQKGELPQLPLAAMMMARGGFDGRGLRGRDVNSAKKSIPRGPVSYMGYWKMTGGKDAGLEEALESGTAETIEIVEEGFKALVRAYRHQDMPYYSVPNPENAPIYNDYEHLARLKEWAALDDVSDEEAA